jgi:choline monooxygenase
MVSRPMNSDTWLILDSYDPDRPLERALTIPASWYLDENLHQLELQTVFARSWQLAGRNDQVDSPGQYITTEIAGSPVVAVRGSDNVLRGFFNVCRHHAATVMTAPEGTTGYLRCPYHGWTYSLEGSLKGTPDFSDVCDFDRAANGLIPVEIAAWEKWFFVRTSGGGPSLQDALGEELMNQIRTLDLGNLHWMERRHYTFDCNWKVFIDNYLDGGYHVPHLHKGLDSVLDYGKYTVTNGERFCLQRSPMVAEGAQPQIGAVRKGDQALYYWIYPNFMINWYQGSLDTNLVIPHGVDKTEVIFDFYFADISEETRGANLASIAVGQLIQDEDEKICRSVQRGLGSRAYDAGRLSVRREAGEHLFHRLLHADLKAGLQR